jgi:hypothetical protein
MGKFRLVGLAAAILVVSGLASVAGASESACPHKSEPTQTFDVTVRPLKDVYEVGETAKFLVRVTRVVDGNELGPVEDAQVITGLTLGDVYLGGGATTDEDGRAVVKVRIKRYAPAGSADALVTASRQIADAPCHSRFENEYGDIEAEDLIRVTR